MNNDNKNNKILSVKNLRVDFWTNNGTVKAVRGISFDLYRGKTLAIVGESGSGKSVTSRAIMGILAPNKIVQEGEILYDGRDILRLSEEELCKIRGSRIAMIFQDPMSSLNPIMKVGRQITEAMMLKKKAEIREAKGVIAILDKRFESVDPNWKAVAKAAKKDEPVDWAKATALSEQLADVNEKAIIAQTSRAIKDLSAMQKFPWNQADGNHFNELKLHLNALKKTVDPLKNYLSEEKDDTIFTFIVTISYYLEEYKNALSREKKAARIKAKKAKKAAKDKDFDPNAQSVKERAWASEIDTSHQAIAKKGQDYFSAFLSYLRNVYPLSLKADPAAVGKSIISLYQKNLAISKEKIDKKDFIQKAIKVMGEVGIASPEKRINQYPFEFSGGMRQRIVIAIALSSNPEILICDEPTTALDVTIQAQILDLINDLKVKRNLSVIFITHNLGVVANMADDIAIMYAGKIVEYGNVDDIFYDPKHPYTWALLSSMPDLDTKERLDAIPGTPPNMIIPPKGDAFASRNKYAMQIDFDEQPPFFKVSDTHYAATWLLDPRAPHVDVPASVANRIARFEKLNEEKAKESPESAPKEVEKQ